MSKAEIFEDISKRRGFIWKSSRIYGGFSGFFDYAHLGSKVKKKFEDLWRDYFLGLNDNFYEIEGSTILPKEVLKASGHLEHFTDPIVKCKKCGEIERADQILEEELEEKFEGLSPKELGKLIKKHEIKCPKCGGELGKSGVLNLMFPLEIGSKPVREGFLRPETAQQAYLNFKEEFKATRKQLPLGLALVGKAFRNEISPRKGVYRGREFTQAELQMFFNPKRTDEHPDFKEVEGVKLRVLPVSQRGNEVLELTPSEVKEELNLPEFYLYYMAKIQEFFLEKLNLPREKFRFKELSEEEKAFYNKYHWDIEVEVEKFGGYGELAGLHYRSEYDLKQHQKESEQSQEIYYKGEKFIPHVLEISFGVDRCVYSLLELSVRKDGDRTYLELPGRLSPYEVAVFPLVDKDGLPEKAKEVSQKLKKGKLDVVYDETGSIGKRYYRQDEIGTKICITVDHKTLEDDSVTLRSIKTTNQIRLKIDELASTLSEILKGKEIEEFGELI